MAQTIYHNFQEDLLAFNFNKAYVGLIDPSRYRGFDTITVNPGGLGNLNFSIGHTVTGIRHTQADGVTQSGPTGIAFTRQGMIVQESQGIISDNLVCGTNASNPFPRTDLIILEHQYNPAVGGQTAIYKVIQGAMGDPNGTPPQIPNPKIQIAIGGIKLLPNATSINPANYSPSQPSMLGGSDLERDHQYTFSKYLRKDIADIKQSPFSVGQEIITLANIDANGILIPTGVGNVLLFTNPEVDTININGIRRLAGLGQKLTIINASVGTTLNINININNTNTNSLIPPNAYIGSTLPSLLGKTTIVLGLSDSVELTDSNGIWYVTNAPNLLAKSLGDVLGPWVPLDMLSYGNGDINIDSNFSNAKANFSKAFIQYKRIGQTIDFGFSLILKNTFPINKSNINIILPLSIGKASGIDWIGPVHYSQSPSQNYLGYTTPSGSDGIMLVLTNPNGKFAVGPGSITGFGKIWSPYPATNNGNTLSIADSKFTNNQLGIAG